MIARPVPHHPYAHAAALHSPTYSDRQSCDVTGELLAEKRRRNAGASARFRDRRKQRERETQDRCQYLERKVQEYESTDQYKRILELERQLEEANTQRDLAQQKLQTLEKEVQWHRSLLNERGGVRDNPPESCHTPPASEDSDVHRRRGWSVSSSHPSPASELPKPLFENASSPRYLSPPAS